jgi:5-methylcytosine-specific restriction endonuclease McrA
MIKCETCGKELNRRAFCSNLCRVHFRRKLGSYVPSAWRREILIRDNNKCVNCGATESLEIDHIFPISKGGKTEIVNLQVLCKKCNSEKSAKIPENLKEIEEENIEEEEDIEYIEEEEEESGNAIDIKFE